MMNRRKGHATMATLAVIGLGPIAVLGTFILQNMANGLQTPDMILMGFEVIILLAVGVIYRRQEAGERRDSDARKAIHERIDKLMIDATGRAETAAEKFGRMSERSEVMREDLVTMTLKIDSVGSKISNQVEASMRSRWEEVDRRFEDVVLRLRDNEQRIAGVKS